MQFKRQAFFTIVCVVIAGCSVKKNTWVSRNYHTLNAYYNVYYNGNEAFMSGQRSILQASKNDYTTLLPIYLEADKELAGKANSDMDVAIEKGKKLIAKHSITVKPKRQSGNTSERYKSFMKKKEYNPMVDDAWLLMGKAYTIKHENLEAINTLEYLNREYEGSAARFESMLWLSKAYINLEQYTNAEAALEGYDLAGNAPDELYGSYMAAYANLLVTQGKYGEALPYMEKAAKNTSKRWLRFRYNYILAQLYQMLGKNSEAAAAYKLVAHNNPDYEMSFNARINMASVVNSSEGAAETEKVLQKLLRDKKNSEYQDQIYYALGNLNLNRGEDRKAISNYRLSVEKSSLNERQKGVSFLALGNLYYSKPQYIEAFESYDSAVVFLSNRHPEFETVSQRRKILENLSVQLRNIRNEDSLMFLARLPEAERMSRIDRMLEMQKQELDKRNAAIQSSNYGSFLFSETNSQNQSVSQQGSKWYFYNVSVAGAGKLEFERRWNKRKNEDNWRRSVKSSISADDQEFQEPAMDFDSPRANQQTGNSSEKSNASDSIQQPSLQGSALMTKESLLAGIPLTEQAKQKSHKILEASLFESAGLLSNQVNDYRSAVQYYERLLNEYPQSTQRQNILIGLYLVFEKLEDQSQMSRLKAIITKESPDSKFAHYLNDPQFFAKQEAQRLEMEQHYETTYSSYLMNDYSQTIAADQQMPNRDENPYVAKYRLIKALSYAKMGDAVPFDQTLRSIVADYPGTDEAKLASALISEIDKGRQPIKAMPYRSLMTDQKTAAYQEQQGGDEVVPFIYSPYELHSAIVVGDSATNMGVLQYNVADYNFGRFLLADYEIEQEQLPDQTQLLLVKGLKNKSEALDYLYTVREQNRLFSEAGLNNPKIVVVSQNNLKNLLMSGNLVEYLKFFKEFYLSVVQEPVKPAKAVEAVVRVEEKVEVKDVNAIERVEDQPESEEKVAETVEAKDERVELSKSVVETSATVKDNGPTTDATVESIYRSDDGSAYSALFLIQKGRIDLRRIQSVITNYTLNNYGEELHGEASDLGLTHRIIKVSGFANRQAAQEYINKFTSNNMLMNSFTGTGHHFIFINETNYQILLDSKNIADYQLFIAK